MKYVSILIDYTQLSCDLLRDLLRMGNDGKYEEGDGPDETGLKYPFPEDDEEEEDAGPLFGLVLFGLVLLGLVLVADDRTEAEDTVDMMAAAVAVVAVVVATAVVGGDKLVMLEMLEILEMLLMLLLRALDRAKEETSGGGDDLEDLDEVELDLPEMWSVSSWIVGECWSSVAVISAFLLFVRYTM